MLTRIALAFLLTIGLTASAAYAAGSSSSSSTPYRSSSDDYARAVRAVNAEDYTTAANLLQKVVQKDSRNADAWNYLGFSERKLGHFDRSLNAYQSALRIQPNHRGANEYLGELYLQTGKLDMAKKQLDKLHSLCPSGCEEYSELQEAIRAHEMSSKSG